MPRAERIKFAFAAFGKARKPVLLANRVDAVAAMGEHFMRVRLMPHIPNQAIMRRIKNRMESHRELDHAQTRPQMPAGFGDALDQFRAQLIGAFLQIRDIAVFNHRAQLRRVINPAVAQGMLRVLLTVIMSVEFINLCHDLYLMIFDDFVTLYYMIAAMSFSRTFLIHTGPRHET